LGRFGCDRLLGVFCSLGCRDAFRIKRPNSRAFSKYVLKKNPHALRGEFF